MRGREHPIVLPDATRTAQSSMHRGSRTRCIPLASVMGIEPIGRWVWRPDRPPPGRTLYDSFLTGESDPVWADGHPIAERVVRRVSGSHKPRPSKKRSPVELPGAVAPTGGCVLCSLLVQDRCVQAVQDGLFGAAFSGALIVLLRAFTRVGLVSSQGISPPPRRNLRRVEKS